MANFFLCYEGLGLSDVFGCGVYYLSVWLVKVSLHMTNVGPAEDERRMGAASGYQMNLDF